MKTCPHCGQAVHPVGPICPLCRQDMRGASSLPETTDTAWDSGVPQAPPTGSTELERLWAGRSDAALEEAAHNLVDYTEEGQRVIRAELQRRSIRIPAPESQEEEEEASGEFFMGERVYSAPVLANVATLKATLESHGIACEIRAAHLGGAAGELPPVETWPELWILDESKAEHARQIVQEALEPPKESTSWTCPRCREDVEGQFSECWNCGSERPAGS